MVFLKNTTISSNDIYGKHQNIIKRFVTRFQQSHSIEDQQAENYSLQENINSVPACFVKPKISISRHLQVALSETQNGIFMQELSSKNARNKMIGNEFMHDVFKKK